MYVYIFNFRNASVFCVPQDGSGYISTVVDAVFIIAVLRFDGLLLAVVYGTVTKYEQDKASNSNCKSEKNNEYIESWSPRKNEWVNSQITQQQRRPNTCINLVCRYVEWPS